MKFDIEETDSLLFDITKSDSEWPDHRDVITVTVSNVDCVPNCNSVIKN